MLAVRASDEAGLRHRVNQTKWVIRPTPSMAQQGHEPEAFEDFYFRVCTQNYASMVPGMQALEALMRQTDRGRSRAPKRLEFLNKIDRRGGRNRAA